MHSPMRLYTEGEKKSKREETWKSNFLKPGNPIKVHSVWKRELDTITILIKVSSTKPELTFVEKGKLFPIEVSEQEFLVSLKKAGFELWIKGVCND